MLQFHRTQNRFVDAQFVKMKTTVAAGAPAQRLGHSLGLFMDLLVHEGVVSVFHSR